MQKWQLAQKEKSADFKSPDFGSSAYTLINYNRLWHIKLFLFFLLQLQLMFIGMRVMRPSRKEISSVLFIFTAKELKWTAMRKNWRPNCTTTGLLHILNLVRWWELQYAFFFSLVKLRLSVIVFWKSDNYLYVCICPKRNYLEKYMCLILASQTYKQAAYCPRYQKASQVLPKINVMVVVWFAICTANQRYLF